MSYDSNPDDPPFDEASMTPPRAGEPWLQADAIAHALGLDETLADPSLGEDARRLIERALRPEGDRAQAWRVAIDLSLGLLALSLGAPDLDPIDDEDSGLYCGGWCFERASLIIDSTESHVGLTVSRYRPTWHWTWQVAGEVSSPYAAVTPLVTAVREALGQLAALDHGARKPGGA
jgi:hypothetical protein